MPEPVTDDFEIYIARRRARLRLGIALGVVAIIAIIAVPYTFMKLGSLKKDTFEIFVAVDFFLLLGLGRAFVIYVKDKTGIGIG